MMKRFFILLTALLSFPLLFSCSDSAENDLLIDIIEVGKADCIVIRCEGTTVMIDTGEEENLPEIEAFLKANDIPSIDCMILSHYDKDHIGGAEKIISSYSVKKVVESSFVSHRKEYLSYHTAADEKGITIEKLEENTQLSIGKLNFGINIPKRSSYERKEDNNASLVVSLKFGDRAFLFCGDAMDDRMDEVLSEKIGTFDLVKLPHHGSFLKRYDEILASFQCTDVVITDSDKNPSDEALLDLLKKKNINCFETRYGSVSIRCDGKNISIKQ